VTFVSATPGAPLPSAPRLHRPAANDEAPLASAALQLAGLHCAACAGEIEAALRHVDGVVDAQVQFAASRAQVRWDPQRTEPTALVAAVRSAGYRAAPDTIEGARSLRRAEERQWLWRLFVAALCSMQVMMLATPVYLAEPGTLAPDIEQLLQRSAWMLSLPVLLFSATPFFVSAWRSLKARRLGMDVPIALGIAVAFVASSGAAFEPGGLFGREVYFDSLTMFVAFVLGGRWLEARARHRAIDTVERLALAAPRRAWRLGPDGCAEEVAVDALVRGDHVRVPVGEAFPADGTILEGTTSVDESLLSGESAPRVKRAGDAAVAGSLNCGAPVTLRVERLGADTRQEQIAALMREALSRRPAAMRVADRIAGPFLAAVLLLAFGAAAWWWSVEPARALWVAVSVLIVTCPCALSLAAPSALLAATSGLAKRGVLLRRIEALEALAEVRHVMLDKTGTVSDGTPVLAGWRALEPAAQDSATLADRAAALAASSTHPLSRALVAARPAAPACGWREVREVAGQGLEAQDGEGRRWRLGSPGWLGADAGIGALCFGPVGRPLLAFDFDDEGLRGDAAATVSALRDEGIAVSLLSGDALSRVGRLAQLLGIADAVAEATPERKLDALRRAQLDGTRVAMVGDGINDAPVLAQADVSFAMGDGAQIARSTADAVLLSGRLSDVVGAMALARRTRAVMRQNLAWAAAYNAACVPLALMGYLPPWAAGLGMAASSLLVVLNALRLSRR
jgi:Cu2+-exporting ATPase